MTHHPWTRAIAATLLLLGLAGGPVLAQTAADVSSRAAPTVDGRQRLALVIGNAAYHDSPLVNPVNDARAMALTLREFGFSVIYRENADLKSMAQALREFGDRLRSGGTGLVYYSGHGMQIKGRNYLVPVDARFEREDEVAYKAVDAQAVLDKMEAASNMANILILDACRNNPFGRSSRSSQQGLAQMDAPVGTIIAYATAPGSVASDGVGISNGLYTRHLLTAMRQPGSKVEDVFKQVRGAVRRESGGAQVPWESTSLEGDFYFMPQAGAASPQTLPAAAPAPPAASALEAALWEAVKSSSLPVELSVYLNRYPNGQFAAQARRRLADLTGAPAPAAAPEAVAVAAAPAPAPAPALAPASPARPNAHGFSSGDRWRFQVVDKFKGEVVRNYAYAVDTVNPDGSMLVNGGRALWDAHGNLQSIRNPEGDLSFPSYAFNPPALQQGARSSINFEIPRRVGDKLMSTDRGRGSMTVRDRERVNTPAGEFDAWRVDIEIFGTTTGQGRDDYRTSQGGMNTWRLKITGWYSAELRSYVAYDEEFRLSLGNNNSSTGVFSQRERHELTSYSLKAGAMVSQR